MWDTLFTNKYFCLAMLVAFGVVAFLYMQKENCNIEGMRNVDLSVLAPELTESPWTSRTDGDDHKIVNNKFDKLADKYVQAKLKHHGYSVTKPLSRSDVSFGKYMQENYGSLKGKKKKSSVPQPLDTRPDLSQCQPCKCPSFDKYLGVIDSVHSVTSSDSSDSDSLPIPSKNGRKSISKKSYRK